jgi:hypothetical protein
MDPVSSTDRLIALLRQKLQERAKTSSRGVVARKGEERRPAEPTGIQALAAVEGVDERQLRRAFIQNLLADQLGPALVNDGQFQQIVTRVTDAIDEDAAASRLLSRVIADLRTA